MKILKNTLTLFALIAVFSTATYAQSEDVEASATVLATLSLTVQDIQFGSIENNVAAELATSNVGTSSNVGLGGTTTQVGQISVAGLANADINVTYNGSATLADATGANTITMTPLVEYNGASFASASDITLDGTGSAVIEIGGQLPATSTAGDYSTTNTNGVPLTFTFDYN